MNDTDSAPTDESAINQLNEYLTKFLHDYCDTYDYENHVRERIARAILDFRTTLDYKGDEPVLEDRGDEVIFASDTLWQYAQSECDQLGVEQWVDDSVREIIFDYCGFKCSDDDEFRSVIGVTDVFALPRN